MLVPNWWTDRTPRPIHNTACSSSLQLIPQRTPHFKAPASVKGRTDVLMNTFSHISQRTTPARVSNGCPSAVHRLHSSGSMSIKPAPPVRVWTLSYFGRPWIREPLHWSLSTTVARTMRRVLKTPCRFIEVLSLSFHKGVSFAGPALMRAVMRLVLRLVHVLRMGVRLGVMVVMMVME